MFITLSIPKFTKENQYESSKIEKILSPEIVGIGDWYGGKIKFIAKMKEFPLYLIVDYNMKTIDTGINTFELENFSASYMREILKKFAVTYNAVSSRDQLYEKFKELFENFETK